jgi:hypothetical protein
VAENRLQAVEALCSAQQSHVGSAAPAGGGGLCVPAWPGLGSLCLHQSTPRQEIGALGPKEEPPSPRLSPSQGW